MCRVTNLGDMKSVPRDASFSVRVTVTFPEVTVAVGGLLLCLRPRPHRRGQIGPFRVNGSYREACCELL
jgi:hypothetical protein